MNKVEFEYTIQKQLDYFNRTFFRETIIEPYYYEDLENKFLEDFTFYSKLSVGSVSKKYREIIRVFEFNFDEIEIFSEKLIKYFEEHKVNLIKVLERLNENLSIDNKVSREITKVVIEDIETVINFIIEEKSIILNTKKEIANDVKPNALNGLPSKILWNNDIKELAYIFYCLKNENIIDITNLGATLSKIFADGSKSEIKKDTFNNYFSDFRSNDYPAKAVEIDRLIKAIKKVK